MRSCRPLFAPNTRWPTLGGSGEGRREHRNVNTLSPPRAQRDSVSLKRSLRTQALPAEPPSRPMCLTIPLAVGPPRERLLATTVPDHFLGRWPHPAEPLLATHVPHHSRGTRAHPILSISRAARATLSRADSTPEADSGLLPLFCVHR